MDHLQSLGHILGKSAKRVHGFFRCAVANQVGIAVRDDYNIARRQLFFPATRQPGIRTAFRQKVEDDQVSRSRRKKVFFGCRWRGAEAPRSGKLTVEKQRATKLD